MDTQDDDALETSDPTVQDVDTGGSVLDKQRALAAAVEAQLFPGLQPVADGESTRRSVVHRLGRFAILRELGQGGMGVVFACYDEKLERKVAVKLLRAQIESETARKRLEREGQALARLSHPNVVQIYELGEHHGAPFVAMEFVVGETLREWHESRPEHEWRETVALLRQAASGLEAAHAAGLVHRDFKPENVIVGADGRVRVLDFGLVRHAPNPSELRTRDEPERDAPTSEEHGSLAFERTGSFALTRAGTVMGTPAYMAPEQFEGQACNALSDQFSFCVVAYELLFGQRPFAGRTFAELSRAATSGAVAPLPAKSPVPRSLQAAILRGLNPQPQARWPEMRSLLTEFDRALGRNLRRRKALAAGLGVAALLTSASAVLLSSADTPAPCSFDTRALSGVWDDERRAALRQAYAEPNPPFAEESIALLDTTLTSWGQRWLDSQHSNCEATRVAGTQSEAMLDLRTACLERQRREVAVITENLTQAESPELGHALELIEQLPDVSRCEDPGLVDEPHRLPSEPARREAILTTYAQLGQARVDRSLARFDPADALLAELEPSIAALEYLPLALESRFEAALLELDRGRLERAMDELHAIVREAEIAGLHEISAMVRTRLALTMVGNWGAAQAQSLVLEEAETAVARVGRADDRRTLDLALARAAWQVDRGNFEQAHSDLEALVAAARAQGQPLRLAWANQKLGRLLVALGRRDEGEAAYRDAQAAFVEAHGPGALSLVRIELDLAFLALERAEFDAARTRIDTLRRSHGPLVEPGSELALMVDLADAKLLFLTGDHDQAEARFGRVAQSELLSVQRGEAWQAIGALHFYADDLPASLDAYGRARADFSQLLDPDHAKLGILDSNIAEALAASGDHQAALDTYAAALTKLEALRSPSHLDLAFPYKGRGLSRLALDQLDAARSDLEHALALHEQDPSEPVERADVEFGLARVLFRSGEHTRALALAKAAQTRAASLDQHRMSAKITAWLDEHDS